MAGPTVEVNSNAAAVAVQYREAPKLVAKSIVKVLRTIGAGVVSYVGREKLSGQVLNPRTSTLRRALFYKVFVDANAMDAGVIVGADRKKAPHARVHEYGGEIRPKRAKHLTIPLSPALTGKGVAKVSAKEFIANPGSLGFDRAFVNPKKTAIMGAVDVGGDEEDIVVEPVFALKDHVTIPERSYLRAGVNERRGWILEQLGMGAQDGIAEALKE